MPSLSDLLPQPPPPFYPPSLSYRLVFLPLPTLLRPIHEILTSFRGPPSAGVKDRPLRLVCISDTHTHTNDIAVPDGDILVHAGDMASAGTLHEIQKTVDWLNSQPHAYKVTIAGNHDNYFDPKSRRTEDHNDQKGVDFKDVIYLQHSSVSLEFPPPSSQHGAVNPKGAKASQKGARDARGVSSRRVVVYGAPHIPKIGSHKDHAFQYPRNQDAWHETVPSDTQILVTHTPPAHHLDTAMSVGCEHLLSELYRVRPQVHVFGHVHAGRGMEYLYYDAAQRAWEDLQREAVGMPWRWIWKWWIWTASVRVLLWGSVGVVWTWLWGGSETGTIAVNAALAHWVPGRMYKGVEPYTVEI